MKAHVGTDRRGIVHSLVTTRGQRARTCSQMPKLLHGQEREVLRRPGLLERVASAGGTRHAASATGSTAGPIMADAHRHPAQPSTACARRPGPAASTPSTWSSACGALPRCATGVWRRTPRGCSPSSPWRTCTCSDDD